MIPGKKYTPEDILGIAWRRKWLIALPTLVASVLTFGYVHQLPDEFRSSSLIMVQPPRVRPDLVRSSVVEPPANRVQTITQQIMSRTRLEAIITDFNLYEDLRRTGLMEDVVERMRDDVEVEVVRGDAFRVSYESRSAITAMKVTERLARLFIDENLRDREQLAQGTSQFLESQLEDARRRLIEQEKRLEAYRRRHAGELPSQLESNLVALNNTQMQVQAMVESISRDRDRLQLLERMLADATEAVTQAPLDPTGAPAPTTAAQQLEAARTTLRALQTRLKPEHPDVVRMTKAVADLEKRADAEALQKPLSPEAGRPRTPAEAARASRISSMQDEAELLRDTIVKKEADEQRLRALIGSYQARAEAAPTRETELIELTRDYDTVQRLYAGLLAKNEESKLAVNLETRQIGEQFRILDPARVPERPFSPDRLRLNAVGVGLGLALGIAIVGLLEWRDTSLKTDGDVLTALALPVLAFVPVLLTREDRRRLQRRRLAAGLASAIVLVMGAAAAFWVSRA